VPGSGGHDLYFRQLLSGRDFARDDQVANQMRNFAYLIGDPRTRRCAVIDPAYAPLELLQIAADDGYEVDSILISHYHADHCGGRMMGMSLPGIVEILSARSMPVFVNRNESEWIMKTTGVSIDSLKLVEGGDVLDVGDVRVSLLHTPGHTPGSQCFMVDGRLVSGDTIFLDGCGRTDLPGGNPEDLFRSLAKLAQLPDDTDLYPGHDYSRKTHAQFSEVKLHNVVYRAQTMDDWLRLFG
jgi:glyoxylase-like metal-dependent hydrolase (beta-lactamase superfamily II)